MLNRIMDLSQAELRIGQYGHGYLMRKNLSLRDGKGSAEGLIKLEQVNKKKIVAELMNMTYEDPNSLKSRSGKGRQKYTCGNLVADYNHTVARDEEGSFHYELNQAEYMLKTPTNDGFVLMKVIASPDDAKNHHLPWDGSGYLYVSVICMKPGIGLGPKYMGNWNNEGTLVTDGIVDRVAKSMELYSVVLGSIKMQIESYKKRGYHLINPETMLPISNDGDKHLSNKRGPETGVDKQLPSSKFYKKPKTEYGKMITSSTNRSSKRKPRRPSSRKKGPMGSGKMVAASTKKSTKKPSRPSSRKKGPMGFGKMVAASKKKPRQKPRQSTTKKPRQSTKKKPRQSKKGKTRLIPLYIRPKR